MLIDERASGTDEVSTAASEGNTLKSEPWTWLWGEIDPRRSVSDQTVEDVRNVEGG